MSEYDLKQHADTFISYHLGNPSMDEAVHLVNELALACDTLRQQLEWRDVETPPIEDVEVAVKGYPYMDPEKGWYYEMAVYRGGTWFAWDDAGEDYTEEFGPPVLWKYVDPIPEHKEGE